jgi:hypothetical protein
MLSDNLENTGISALVKNLFYDDYYGEITICKEELSIEEQQYLYGFSEKHDLMYTKDNNKIIMFENPERGRGE